MEKRSPDEAQRNPGYNVPRRTPPRTELRYMRVTLCQLYRRPAMADHIMITCTYDIGEDLIRVIGEIVVVFGQL